MTDKEKKESFLEAYKTCYGNLSKALKISEVKTKDFDRFMDAHDFKMEVEAVKQYQDDFILGKFLDLVDSGDPRAIIEAQKMRKERSTGIDVQDLRVKAMVYFINTADTKGKVLSEFCDWFMVAESTAESFYKKVLIENKLKSPLERKKQKDKDYEKRLDIRFDNNDIDEVSMYRELIRIQLSIIEDAEYPGEKAKASNEVLNLTRRLDEIQDRENKKRARSNEEISVLMDAQLFGITTDEVKRLEFEYNGKKIESKNVI
tara:strand:- start:103 stop:882 length:780 start_codon:yes stop_codon:yes gene_type:complete